MIITKWCKMAAISYILHVTITCCKMGALYFLSYDHYYMKYDCGLVLPTLRSLIHVVSWPPFPAYLMIITFSSVIISICSMMRFSLLILKSLLHTVRWLPFLSILRSLLHLARWLPYPTYCMSQLHVVRWLAYTTYIMIITTCYKIAAFYYLS